MRISDWSSDVCSSDLLFYLVGKKGRAVIQRVFPKQIVHQVDLSQVKNLKFADAQAVSDDIIRRVEAGEFDVAHLFYAKFQSALVQTPVGQQIIPVPLTPANANEATGSVVEYEPDEEAILAELLPRNVAVQIFLGLLENAAARMSTSLNSHH